MRKSALILATLFSLCACLPAMASPSSSSIRTADLDLTSTEGRARLARRISFAAEQVCFVEGDRSLSSFMLGRACYNEVVRDAHSQLVAKSGAVALAN